MVSYAEQKEWESTYMMTTYGRKPVQFVRGEGMRLYDDEGREYLDFLSGIGCVCLGHAAPAVTEALAKQAAELMQVSNYYYSSGRGEWARDLSDLLNNGNVEAAPWKTFFANSGAEANEGALKLARKYGKLTLQGAGTVLTARRSFHGRTLATTAACGQEVKQESFTPMPAGFAHFEPGSYNSLLNALAECSRAARREGHAPLAPVAVMLECIQGEGGVWPLDEEYLQSVRSLTAAQGLLLIIDEVQTGFYRTGAPFAFMHAGIRPDVVTMAKGIANGFPCGAVAATGVAANILVPGEHGSTFGGNPLAVAAGRATLAELTAEDTGAAVRALETFFKAELAKLPHCAEVRGKGLMLGVSLDKDCAAQVAGEALAAGMVINAIGTNILRFLPPFCVSEQDITTLMGILRSILEKL